MKKKGDQMEFAFICCMVLAAVVVILGAVNKFYYQEKQPALLEPIDPPVPVNSFAVDLAELRKLVMGNIESVGKNNLTVRQMQDVVDAQAKTIHLYGEEIVKLEKKMEGQSLLLQRALARRPEVTTIRFEGPVPVKLEPLPKEPEPAKELKKKNGIKPLFEKTKG